MSIEKYGNQQYSGNIPLRVGDRRFSQDRVRDFWFKMDRMGQIYNDIVNQLPILLSGGVVTQGTGASLDITAGYGYAKFNVEIPNSFASTPPTKLTADVESIRVKWATQNDINASSANCSVYSITDDGVTVHYVKMRYLEENGNTRARAKAVGTYAYEITPSFDLQVDTVAPTNYDILLATFTSAAGTYTITPSTTQVLNYPTIKDINDWINAPTNILTKTSNYTILDSDLEGYSKLLIYVDTNSSNVTITGPTLAANQGKKIEIFVIDDTNLCTFDGEGTETIDGVQTIELPKIDNYLEIIGQTSEWKILAEKISNSLKLRTYAGFGSTDNKIMRFTNVVENFGNLFSENHSTGYNGNTEGLEITINKAGKYSFTFSARSAAGTNIRGLSLNSTQLTTSIASINEQDILSLQSAPSGAYASVTWTGYLNVGDVIRPHTDGGVPSSTTPNVFTMSYLGS